MTKICYFRIFYFITRVNILDYTFSIEYKRLSEIRFLRNVLAEIDNGHFPFLDSNILTKNEIWTTKRRHDMSAFCHSIISRVCHLSCL